MTSAQGDLWVFGYGSLMWRPGFPFAEQTKARLDGYRRCFCVYSTHHRGCPQRPGLVLGLDRGGSCEGVAFRVDAAHSAVVRSYLRAREQISGVYRETFRPVQLLDGSHRQVEALAFIVERAHPSYARRLTLGRQCRLIRGARGISGVNLDYLINTVRHLEDLRLRDPELRRLLVLIGPHIARGCGNDGDGATGHNPRTAALLADSRRLPADVKRLTLGQRRRFLYRLRLEKNGGTNS